MLQSEKAVLSKELRAFRRQLIYVLTIAFLLAVVQLAETVVVQRLEPLIPSWVLEQGLLAAFIILALAYFVARIILRAGGLVTDLLSRRPAFKPLVPLARVSFAVAALIAFLVTGLRVLAYRVTAVAGVVEWLSQAFLGFFSTLIALVLAMQVREIVGNYLAWAVIKAGNLIERGEYISLGDEVYRVVRIDYSHTIMLNCLNEEVYVPNLRFLLEIFRKEFSRTARMFVSVRFTLPYSYPLERVREGAANAIKRYSQRYDGAGTRALVGVQER